KANPIILGQAAPDTTFLYEQLLAGKTITGVEVRRFRKDGSAVTISLSATPIWDENRKVKGIIKFLTDITEQKRSEEALRNTEEKYRSIFENSLEGIFQTTPEGKYISANPALARMLGFDSPDELVNTRNDVRTQEYVNPELHSEFVCLLEERGVVENF